MRPDLMEWVALLDTCRTKTDVLALVVRAEAGALAKDVVPEFKHVAAQVWHALPE